MAMAAVGGPAAKRQRIEQPERRQKLSGSRIFAPYRTVGLISPTNVPFTSVPMGKTTFQLTTSTGRALHTYDLRRGLQLVFVSRPPTPGKITATFAWKGVVFTAWDNGTRGLGVWIFKRGQKIAECQLPADSNGSILRLQVLGSWLVAVAEDRIEVWKIIHEAKNNWEHYTTIQNANALGLRGEKTSFSGAICTVPTLLNKILIGKTDGALEIWNVRTGKMVYSISPPGLTSGSVTALEPSPAVAIVAVARADGSVILHDIVRDRILVHVKSDHTVTSITFRTDGLGAGEDGQREGVMATAGEGSGDIVLWDLNVGGKIQAILRHAHSPPPSSAGSPAGGLSRIEFLPGQPVIVSSGLDNALKTWILDQSPFNPVPRPLHTRSGHAGPVTKLQFLPTQTDGSDSIGKWLLSAGRDCSLWGWSLRRDNQSTELSQGNIQKKAKKLGFDGKRLKFDSTTSLEDLKAPEITCLAANLNRDGGMGTSTGGGAVWSNQNKPLKDPDAPVTGWESMVTGHRGDKFARTWFWGRKKAGRWAFETGDKSEVASVAMSPCGTFALVGSAGGAIEMFNLQSGISRQTYPRRLTPGEQKKAKLRQKIMADGRQVDDDDPSIRHASSRHTRDVTGLVVDSMNQTLVSSSLDGKIKFWDFMSGELRHEIDKSLTGGFIASRFHRASGLLALSCDDMSIQIIDIETKKTVRELWGCVGQIKDFTFSNDGRWIVAASADSVLRVWDLPTGHLIDAVRLESVCTSLSFSPTGEFLATSHADNIGISVWSNRSLFRHIPTKHIAEDPVLETALPSASGEDAHGLLAAAFEEGDESDLEEEIGSTTTLDQLRSSVATLSLVPRSRWQTLLHLDLIAQRNKPIEPPKAPEKAPFFLPSLDDHKTRPQLTGTGGTANGALDKDADALIILDNERSRIAALRHRSAQSLVENSFTTLLHACAAEINLTSFSEAPTTATRPQLVTACEALVSHLKALAPAAADIEIRSLHLSGAGGHVNELACFVRALTERLRQRRDYELIQAWITVFLRIHGETVTLHSDTTDGRPSNANADDEDEVDERRREVRHQLEAWQQLALEERRRIGGLVGYCGGVVQFLRSAR